MEYSDFKKRVSRYITGQCNLARKRGEADLAKALRDAWKRDHGAENINSFLRALLGLIPEKTDAFMAKHPDCIRERVEITASEDLAHYAAITIRGAVRDELAKRAEVSGRLQALQLKP